MTNPLKIIKSVMALQLVKSLTKHFRLEFDITIAIVIVLKADNDKWLPVTWPNFTSVSDPPTIINLYLQETMVLVVEGIELPH